MEARLTEQEAFDRIMEIINEGTGRHYIAREVENARKKNNYDNRGANGALGKFGILYTPIVEMAFGEHGFDHVIFETNTGNLDKLEKLRKHILDYKYKKGINVTTKRDGRNMICFMANSSCTFTKPLRVSYIFKEEWGL